MRLKHLFYLVVVVGLVLSGVGCEKKPDGAAGGPGAGGPPGGPPGGGGMPMVPVTVGLAEAQTVPVYLDAIGRTVPDEQVEIRPQVSGRIERIEFENGADVKPGQLLFVIDKRPFAAALQEAEAKVEKSKQTLELSRLDYERMKRAIEAKAVSQQEYDTAASNVKVALASVATDEASLVRARLDLEYCEIRSPLPGRAGERQTDIGNVVSSGAQGNVLLRIQRLEPINVDFTVSERFLPEIRRRMAESKEGLEVQVSVPDEVATGKRSGEKPLIGRLSFLDNGVADQTGTVRLRAKLDNQGRYFWAGQFVRVRLVMSALEGAVVAPAAAVKTAQVGEYVLVVNKEPMPPEALMGAAWAGKVELRPVTTGQRQGETGGGIVVTSGLKAGEQVITEGGVLVMPGGMVRVMPAMPPGGMPPGGPATQAAGGAGGAATQAGK